jgi:hypothetical protein
VRDVDRDGDPAPACGGRDCDDRDGRRTGSRAETCDGVDNDCNGLADEGLVPSLTTGVVRAGSFADATLSSVDGAEATTASVVEEGGARCILVHGERGVAIAPPCTFLGKANGALPTQPFARPISGGDVTFGVAFSDVGSACALGRIAFRNTKGVGFDNPCGTGESLPAFLPYPAALGRDVALIASVRAPPAANVDPTGACPKTGAPLDLAWIDRPGSLDPAPRIYASRLGLTTTRSPRAVSLLPRGADVLLAAPADGSVGVWLLRAPAPDGSGASVIPLVAPGTIPVLADALSVSAALATTSAGEVLALAAEIGCVPRQRIVLAFVRLDDPGPVATPAWDAVLADDEPLATGPRVAWLASRREWWTAWVARGSVVARAASEAGGLGTTITGEVAEARSAAPRALTDGSAVQVDVLSAKALATANAVCP